MENNAESDCSLDNIAADDNSTICSIDERNNEIRSKSTAGLSFGPLVGATPMPTDFSSANISEYPDLSDTVDPDGSPIQTVAQVPPCVNVCNNNSKASFTNRTPTKPICLKTKAQTFDRDSDKGELSNMLTANNGSINFSDFSNINTGIVQGITNPSTSTCIVGRSALSKSPAFKNEEEQCLLEDFDSDSNDSSSDLQNVLLKKPSASEQTDQNKASASFMLKRRGFHCHNSRKMMPDRVARAQLLAVCVLCILFMIGESVGGFLASSLALFTDVVHLASDLISFLISLLAIYLSNKAATKTLSFGYHRAEVVGALTSVLIIWLVTGVLLYMAIERIVHEHYKKVKADEMLITASVGVVFNIIMGAVLHMELCCKHIGFSLHHGHSHSNRNPHKNIERLDEGSNIQYQSMDDIMDESEIQLEEDTSHKHKNINVRAAFIHVLGDLIQSIGVFVAALIIKFVPDERYRLADPICTFLFCILVLCTTIPILRDALLIIMEGTPRDIVYDEMKNKLLALPSVKLVHSLKIWSLTMDRHALAVHLCIDPICDQQKVLRMATEMLQSKELKIFYTAIQIEELYSSDIKIPCLECDGPLK